MSWFIYLDNCREPGPQYWEVQSVFQDVCMAVGQSYRLGLTQVIRSNIIRRNAPWTDSPLHSSDCIYSCCILTEALGFPCWLTHISRVPIYSSVVAQVFLLFVKLWGPRNPWWLHPEVHVRLLKHPVAQWSRGKTHTSEAVLIRTGWLRIKSALLSYTHPETHPMWAVQFKESWQIRVIS